MTVHVSPVSEVIEDFRAGKFVIIVDDADRENEGDLAVATEKITPAHLGFMMEEARGLICVSISQELGEALRLPPQAGRNTSRFHTPFTVSIDLRSHQGLGQPASARVETLRRLIDKEAQHADFVSPGSVYPLIANPAGVLAREGQTEGSYDLARLAGLTHSGVICEILRPDGNMARAPELNAFAAKHGIKITTIEELIRYRLQNEALVRKTAHARLHTSYGECDTFVFESDGDGKEHLALVFGGAEAWASDRAPLLRIHSECLTGDVFGSRRCDCGGQLDQAMNQIKSHGFGVLLYLRQEGRGIGLGNKLRAYQLQDQGRDTVEANVELGFAPDERDFAVAAQMLVLLGIRRVDLLTNNPRKLETLVKLGIEVRQRIPLLVTGDPLAQEYLKTKRDKLGHLL